MSLKDQSSYLKLKEHLDLLLKDEFAVKYCCDLWLQLQLFDDIYDEGVLDKESSLKLIQLSMVEIPNNPFFVRFQPYLQPLQYSLFLQWVSANKEEDTKGALHKAYMLRAFIFQIVHLCSSLLFGVEYAKENSQVFQELYGETFEEYQEEFK